MRTNHDINRRWLFLATLCGVTASLHCSSSDSGGNGSTASGNVAAFVGSWTCTLTETYVYSEPPGTPTRKVTKQDTTTFTQIGPNEITDGGECPTNYRVSGNTATAEPMMGSCTDKGGTTVSNGSGSFTVGGGRLTGTVHATAAAKTATGANVVADGTIQADCKPGILPDGGAGAGGSSSSDGGSGNSQGGSIDQGGGVSFGGSDFGNGGASDIGGAGNGGAGNGSGGSVAIDAGSSDCGSYPGAPTLGTCMPQSAAPTLVTLYWSQDSCATGELCVATTKAVDPTSKFAACGTVDVPGACWPSYILEDSVSGTGSLFPQGSCNAGEECAPCTNTVVPALMFCND